MRCRGTVWLCSCFVLLIHYIRCIFCWLSWAIHVKLNFMKNWCVTWNTSWQLFHCGVLRLVKKIASQNVWPRVIRINELIKTAQSAVSKHCTERDFFDLRRHLQKFENVTWEARQRMHFRGFFGKIFVCSTPSKKRCFSTQEFTRCVTASSHALWRVLSNKVIWVHGHV